MVQPVPYTAPTDPHDMMVGNVDRNVRAITAIENSWQLPNLPDMVKLDLAVMSGMDPRGITEFAYGLNDDILTTMSAPTQIEVAQAPIPPPREPEPDTGEPFGGWPDMRQFMRGMAGLPAPEDIEGADSVKAWKDRAVRRGYLDARDVNMDNRWDPAFNSIAYEMSMDDFNRRKQGDHPGPGSSIEQLGEFFWDWMSLTGLGNAAVALGFWWDTDRIKQQATDWTPLESFQKWRMDGDLKDLWRTLGPVDDLLLPIFNIALLATGVGEVLAFSRATVLATNMAVKAGISVKGLRAWQVANGAAKWQYIDRATGFAIHTPSYVGRAKYAGIPGRLLGASRNVSDDLARMQRPGLLGGRKFIGETLGDSMAAWRNLRPVMIAKKSAQQTMRIGFASRLESRLGYEGTGLKQWEPGLITRIEDLSDNPLVWAMGEAMFTPYNILQPGYIGNPFGFTKNWSKVGQAAYYTDEFANAVRRQIILQGDQVSEVGMNVAQKTAHRNVVLKEWNKTVRRDGSSKALADRFTGGDRNKLGGWMTWTSTMAVIEANSQMVAKSARGGKAVKGAEAFIDQADRYDSTFHLVRNRTISQIRYIDPDDIDGFFWYKALSEAKTVREAKNLHESMMRTYNGSQSARTRVQGHIARHNESRIKVWAGLMDQHMQPGLLQDAMTDSLMKYGKWDDFVEGMDDVNAAYLARQLNDAHYAPVHSPETGALVGGKRGRIIKEQSFVDQPEARHWLFDFDDVMADPEFVKFADDAAAAGGGIQGVFSHTTRSFPKTGRYTLAKQGTKMYQDKAAELSIIRFLSAARDAAKGIRTTGSRKIFEQALKRAGKQGGFTNMSEVKFGQILAEMNVENVAKHAGPLLNADDIKYFKRVQRYVRRHEIPAGVKPDAAMDDRFFTPYLQEMEAHLNARLSEISRSDRWAFDYGIDSTMALDDKVKALQRQLHFTAVEVDLSTVPAELAERITAKGYKLVHGTEFASPVDLQDLMVEISDLVDKTKYMTNFGAIPGRIIKAGHEGAVKAVRGVGRATQRYEPDYVTAAYHAQLRTSLHKALIGHVGIRHYDASRSADLEQVMDVLRLVSRDLKDEGMSLVKTKQDLGRLSPSRAWINMRSAFIPATPADLVRSPTIWRQAVKKLRDTDYLSGAPFSDDELARIYRGLKGARVVGRTIRGSAVHGMDKLQATPNVANFMRLLGRTAVGQDIASPVGRGVAKLGAFGSRAAFTAAGGAVGTFGYEYYNDPPPDPTLRDSAETFLARFSAALMGRAAGGKFVARAFRGTGVAAGAGKGLTHWWKLDDPQRVGKIRRSVATLSSPSQWANRLDASVSRQHWSYLADDLAVMRDYFRFTLSPIFDLSRYTEGMVLAQIGGVPEDIIARGGLRFNISPSKWRKTRAKELAGGKGRQVTRQNQADALKEWNEVVDDFAQQGMRRKDFDFDALEAGSARFRQIGIVGFNTTEWMASMYADLTKIHKMDPMKAYETARSAFTYGTKPRSAAEMTVNAVFFPFSFMKKSAGHAAKFLSEDWTRAAMMHDAVRTYSLLNEEYDLDRLWRDRAPFLEKFQRLNIFAYGVTPGEFGGANRPLIDFWNTTPMAAGTTDQLQNMALIAGKNTPIFNLFIPQGLTVKSEEEMLNADRLIRRIAPLYNDITALIEDMREQGHVFFGGSGITQEAEATLGFELVHQKKNQIDAWIRMQGNPRGIEALRSFPKWADELRQFRRETMDMLPGYKETYEEVIFNSIVRDQEYVRYRDEYRAWVGANPDAPGGRPPADDPEMRVGYLISRADYLTTRYRDYDYVPLDQIDTFMNMAGQWAAEDDYVRIKWRQFLKRTFGPIETIKD